MVAESDYGLVEGLQMLENSMLDNLVALDLVRGVMHAADGTTTH